MDVLNRSFLAVVVALACWGCNPDTPTRACDSQEDCFTQERCISGGCFESTLLADATPPMPREDAAGTVDDAATSDAAIDMASMADGEAPRLDGKVVDGDRPDGPPVTPDAADPDAANADGGPDGVAPDGAFQLDGGPNVDGGPAPDGAPDVDGGVVADGGPDGAADAAPADAVPDGEGGIDRGPDAQPVDGGVDSQPLDAGNQMMFPDAAREPA